MMKITGMYTAEKVKASRCRRTLKKIYCTFTWFYILLKFLAYFINLLSYNDIQPDLLREVAYAGVMFFYLVVYTMAFIRKKTLDNIFKDWENLLYYKSRERNICIKRQISAVRRTFIASMCWVFFFSLIFTIYYLMKFVSSVFKEETPEYTFFVDGENAKTSSNYY